MSRWILSGLVLFGNPMMAVCQAYGENAISLQPGINGGHLLRPAAQQSGETLSVFLNVVALALNAVEYNIKTCALFDYGTIIVTTPPAHGNISFGKVNLPINSNDKCNGVIVSQTAAYYTWTDTSNTSVPSDSFSLSWITKDKKGSYSNNWTADLEPRLMFNGRDITGKTVTVATGEQIHLTLSGMPSPPASQNWIISGTTVGSYTPSAAAPCNFQSSCILPAILTNSDVTFYWLQGATANSVSFAFQLSDGTSSSASASFRVEAPTKPSVTAIPGIVGVYNGILSSGDFANGKPGMSFFPSANAPKSHPGHFVWAQIETSDYIKETKNGKVYVCKIPPGLDNFFPYPSNTNTDQSTNDTPSVPLNNIYTEEVISDNFKMYLMWQSNLANSIPVPLGSISWGWIGDAVRDGKTGAWILKGGADTASLFRKSDDFPQWDSTIINGVLCP
jgi:hypothetical protein